MQMDAISIAELSQAAIANPQPEQRKRTKPKPEIFA
jgi:hypothetical protein